MANDGAYYRADSTNPVCIGTRATEKEAVEALILNIEKRKKEQELIFGLTRPSLLRWNIMRTVRTIKQKTGLRMEVSSFRRLSI